MCRIDWESPEGRIIASSKWDPLCSFMHVVYWSVINLWSEDWTLNQQFPESRKTTCPNLFPWQNLATVQLYSKNVFHKNIFMDFLIYKWGMKSSYEEWNHQKLLSFIFIHLPWSKEHKKWNGMKIIIVSSLPNSENVSIYSVTLAIIWTP